MKSCHIKRRSSVLNGKRGNLNWNAMSSSVKKGKKQFAGEKSKQPMDANWLRLYEDILRFRWAYHFATC